MARLLAPYTLCPLTDHKRFFGVTEDSSSGCVIVTLGRNIVIRYRLCDQKQVSSWSSKSILSSSVVYNHIDKSYVGVFNSEHVGFWEDSLVQLNNIKKHKFLWLIHSVLSSKECPPVILYKNGIVRKLSEELPNRKTPSTESQKELIHAYQRIINARLVWFSEFFVVITVISRRRRSTLKLLFIPVDSNKSAKYFTVHPSILSFTLIEGTEPQVVALKKNGSLVLLTMLTKNNDQYDAIERNIATVDCISCESPCVMLSLGEDHIAIYGASLNSEGALLTILSLKFGLPEAQQKMKVYDKDCKLWKCQNNIMVASGGHLIVIPFVIGTAKLVALLGVGYKQEKHEVQSEKIKDKVKELNSKGLSDHMISDILIGELIEKNNNDDLLSIIHLLKDMPDHWLIEIANFASNNDNNVLLNAILYKPTIGDRSTLEILRSKIQLSTALKLLKAIADKINENDVSKNLIDWASLLIDSHYQQYILSKDENVIETINAVQLAVQQVMGSLKAFNEIMAEIKMLRRGKTQNIKHPVSSHSYLIETIKLY